MVELDHTFTTDKPIDDNWGLVLDLERLDPVRRGRLGAREDRRRERQGRDQGQDGRDVDEVQGDGRPRRVRSRQSPRVLRVKAREAGGQGHANADVTFALSGEGGSMHTAAQITGKAASMGEGMVSTVLDALIKDFTTKFAAAA